MAVEIKYEDVVGMVRAGANALQVQGPDASAGADGIEGIMSSVNKTIDNIKDLVALLKDSGLMGALGMGGRSGPFPQVYRGGAAAAPSLAQQAASIIHRISSAAGDITLAEAIALVAQQYGSMKLSDLEALLNATGSNE